MGRPQGRDSYDESKSPLFIPQAGPQPASKLPTSQSNANFFQYFDYLRIPTMSDYTGPGIYEILPKYVPEMSVNVWGGATTAGTSVKL